MLAYVSESLGHWYGTSLASPIFASVVTMVSFIKSPPLIKYPKLTSNQINQERTLANKGPVGFINPTLYQNPVVLNDITNGSNPNCDSDGFAAVQGWDPVTGLGTPNYPRMLELFMRLP